MVQPSAVASGRRGETVWRCRVAGHRLSPATTSFLFDMALVRGMLSAMSSAKGATLHQSWQQPCVNDTVPSPRSSGIIMSRLEWLLRRLLATHGPGPPRHLPGAHGQPHSRCRREFETVWLDDRGSSQTMEGGTARSGPQGQLQADVSGTVRSELMLRY